MKARAFTIMEVFVLLVVVSVLMAILLPALFRSRHDARRVEALAHLRGHMGVLAAYASDYDDLFPDYTNREGETVLRTSFGEYKIPGYFAGYFLWHVAIADQYYSGNAATASFRTPLDRDATRPWGTYYYLSATVRAQPDFWNRETRRGPSQWRTVRHAQVADPAKKGILWDFTGAGSMRYISDIDLSYSDPPHKRRHPTGFADGHAEAPRASEFTRPHLTGEGSFPGSWWSFGLPVMHTPNGVAGRDID